MNENIFLPSSVPNTVRTSTGQVLAVPNSWELLPPGDATLTRRVKNAGEHWLVQEKMGRKIFSRGVWAPATTIQRIRGELEAERSTERYAQRKLAESQRRAKTQATYVEDFVHAVELFLDFHPAHSQLARRLAQVISEHATPIGSGTVARTQRIPLERRAEAAVIAWMRHQTTAYDTMIIPRVRGKRREVRQMLAARSRALLARYRQAEVKLDSCPIASALSKS